jgi:hypothetical protein
MMTRHIAPVNQPADDYRVEAQHRCLNCNGIIVGLADQDLGLGLNVKLGLVSDQCALVCNDCTARLIAARTSEVIPKAQRR